MSSIYIYDISSLRFNVLMKTLFKHNIVLFSIKCLGGGGRVVRPIVRRLGSSLI